AQIVGALAQLVEEAGVLDGDHRLSGEVLQQLDLFVGKRAYVFAVDDNGTDHLTFPQHRHAKQCTNTAAFDTHHHYRITLQITFGSRKVRYVDRSRCSENAYKQRFLPRAHRLTLHVLNVLWIGIALSHQMECVPIVSKHKAKIGHAQARRITEEALKDRFQFAGRRADGA